MAINGHQWSSVVISGHRPLTVSSEVISGHQRSSEVISGHRPLTVSSSLRAVSLPSNWQSSTTMLPPPRVTITSLFCANAHSIASKAHARSTRTAQIECCMWRMRERERCAQWSSQCPSVIISGHQWPSVALTCMLHPNSESDVLSFMSMAVLACPPFRLAATWQRTCGEEKTS